MPVSWDEFEAVDAPESNTDWSQFEPVTDEKKQKPGFLSSYGQSLLKWSPFNPDVNKALASSLVRSGAALSRADAYRRQLIPVPILPGDIPAYLSKPPTEVQTPAQAVKSALESPAARIADRAEALSEQYLKPSAEAEKTLPVKTAEFIGGFAPLIASGPAAPLTIGMQSFGEHIKNDYEAAKAKGLSDEEAGNLAFQKASASGALQAGVFAFLPKPLRSLGEKFIVDRVGSEGLKRFLAGRVASGLEGAALGAASQAGENVVQGKSPMENVGAAALGLGLPNLLFPYGKTRAEMGRPPPIPPERPPPFQIGPGPRPMPDRPAGPPQNIIDIEAFLKGVPAAEPPPITPKKSYEGPIPVIGETPKPGAVSIPGAALQKMTQLGVINARIDQLQREFEAAMKADDGPAMTAAQDEIQKLARQAFPLKMDVAKETQGISGREFPPESKGPFIEPYTAQRGATAPEVGPTKRDVEVAQRIAPGGAARSDIAQLPEIYQPQKVSTPLRTRAEILAEKKKLEPQKLVPVPSDDLSLEAFKKRLEEEHAKMTPEQKEEYAAQEHRYQREEALNEYMVKHGATPREFEMETVKGGKIKGYPDPVSLKAWIVEAYDKSGKLVQTYKKSFLKSALRDADTDFGLKYPAYEEATAVERMSPVPEHLEGLIRPLKEKINFITGKAVPLKRDIHPVFKEMQDLAAKLGIIVDDPIGPYDANQYRSAAVQLSRRLKQLGIEERPQERKAYAPEGKEPQAGGIPPVVEQPVIPESKGEAQIGTPQREGPRQKGQKGRKVLLKPGEEDLGKRQAAPEAAINSPQKIADDLGLKFEGEQMGRWMFTARDKSGKLSSTFVVKAGADPYDVLQKYQSKIEEYGDQPDAPRPASKNQTQLSYDLARSGKSVQELRAQQADISRQMDAAEKSGDDQALNRLAFKSQYFGEAAKFRQALDEAARLDNPSDAQLAAIETKYGVGDKTGKELRAATETDPLRRQSYESRVQEEMQKGVYGNEPAHPQLQQILARGGTVREALELLSKTSKEGGELARLMLERADEEGLNVRMINDPEAHRSYYHTGRDELAIAGVRQQVPVLEVIHEIAHALTSRKIPSFLTKFSGPKYRGETYLRVLEAAMDSEKTPPEVRRLIEVYLRAVEAHPEKDKLMAFIGDPDAVRGVELPYGMGHLEEFIAEAFSRKSFQELLESMPGVYNKHTLWDSFVDAVRKILNLPVKAHSMLRDALQASADVIAARRPEGAEAWGERYADIGETGSKEFKDWVGRYERLQDLQSDLIFRLGKYQMNLGAEKRGGIYGVPPQGRELEAQLEYVRKVIAQMEQEPQFQDYQKTFPAGLGEREEGFPRIGPGLERQAAPGGTKLETPGEMPANKYIPQLIERPISTFIEQDVKPLLKGVAGYGKSAIDLMVKTVAPATRAKRSDVDILFTSKGEKEKFLTQVAASFENTAKLFDKMDMAQQIDFIDRVKLGKKQATPELDKIALVIRKLDNDLYAAIKEFKPDLPYLENHMRSLWKVIPGSDQAKELLAKRGISLERIMSKIPWRGGMGFLRGHTLETFSEGIQLGGVPVTTNPMEMFMLHSQDVMKYVAANRAWRDLKKTGSAVFVKHGEAHPPGFRQIKDSIAKAYFRTKEGLISSAGEWWVNDGAARMINNYLSRDYLRQGTEGHPELGALGRGFLAMKNATTAIELGMSPFHAVFESNEVIGSSFGLGLAKMTSGRPVEGLKEFVSAVASPKTVSKLGSAAIRYAKNAQEFKAADPETYNWFTSKFPEAESLINDLFIGGGQLGMHQDYRIRGLKGFREAVKNDNEIGAIVRAIPALNEVLLRPLFETYIPRLKVGTFLREYSFELERRAKDLESGRITRAELSRKTWAFVEDRFGELNWDNLYWNRTFKTAMQLAFRSVTWKLGNLRGFGKAGRDIAQEAFAPFKGQAGQILSHFDATAELGRNWMREGGRAPRVTLPMAWLVGMSIITAIESSVITKAATGKYPWELAKDTSELLRNLTFPRIDEVDESQRVSIPTYWKDAVHLTHSVPDYIQASMTGEIGRAMDVWRNRDFYGTEVFHPDDPLLKKAYDAFTHMVPLPFGLSSYVAAHRTGATGVRAGAGFLGFTKAPYYMSYSPAEQEAFEVIRAKMPIGARTREVYQRGVNERIAVDAIKRHEMTLTEAIQKGLIKPNRRAVVGRRIQEPPLIHAVKSPSLTPDEALRIFQKANQKERESLDPIIRKKIRNSKTLELQEKGQRIKMLEALEAG